MLALRRAARRAAGRRGRAAAAGAGAARWCWCRCRRGRACVRARGHDPTYALTARRPRLLRRRRAATRRRAAAAQPRRVARPGRARTPPSGPPTSPGRCAARPAPLRRLAGAAAAGLGGRLRRRAHHRRHRPRGAAGARGGRAARSPGSRRWPRPAGGRPVRARILGLTAFVAADDRLTSVHGVRPGPWLRRRGAPDTGRPVGKPMPVAGETVHVRRVRGSRRCGSRSRCGLVVSPAPSPSSDAATAGEGQ